MTNSHRPTLPQLLQNFAEAEKLEKGDTFPDRENFPQREERPDYTGGANPQLVENFPQAEKSEDHTREESRSRNKGMNSPLCKILPNGKR